MLLAHILACSRIDLYALFEADVSPADRARFRELVKQRAKGEPVAYLVGRREFYSLDFAVSPNVLIPRPETELLVGEALAATAKDLESSVLDLGTGSGAIAITIAVHRAAARIVATDISDAALQIAAENAKSHGVADRIAFTRSNLFDKLEKGVHWDVIVSNPPYIRDREMPGLPVDVRDFEPLQALCGGSEGLDVLIPIIEQSPAYLRQGGWLFLEFGIDQEQALRSAAEHAFESVRIVSDFGGRPRVIMARRR